MVFRFDNILENWAEIYKPLSHDPKAGSKDCTYYRIRTIDTQNTFMRNQNTAKTPCMAYSVLIDAESTSAKTISYLHTIYFMTKTHSSLAKTPRQDDMQIADMQLLMDEMVQDLLAYLYDLRHNGRCPITGRELSAEEKTAIRGLQLEKSEWASLPVKFADFWVLSLQIEQTMQHSTCINPEVYKVPNPVAPEGNG